MGLERKSPQSPNIQPEKVPRSSLPKAPRVGKEKNQRTPASSGLFEERKEWQRTDLARRLRKASPEIPGTGGRSYTVRERGEMVEKLFPWQRFQSHISKEEAGRRLRELRREEYEAKTGAEKLIIQRQRKYLEREFGLGGKS